MLDEPLRHLPPEGAPLREWLRPLSGRCPPLREPDEHLDALSLGQRISRMLKRRKPISNAKKQKIAKMRRSGASRATIVEAVGLSPRSVDRVLSDLGLTR